MSRAAFALALVLALPAAQAGEALARDDGPRALADDSRWASFVELVAARWRSRTEVIGDREGENRRLAAECFADAWYLAIPSLVATRRSPCAKLVAALPAPKEANAREAAKTRASFRTSLRPGALPPTRSQYAACVAQAIRQADPELVPFCALAVLPRASVEASLTDDDRFGGWLASCKKAMLGPAAFSPASGRSAPKTASHNAAADEEARHCLRTLPTLYEVQWLKKLSDFWTPAQLRALRRRSRELGREEAP